MPEHFIREATGRAPRDFYSAVGFSGNHPATLALVNNGTFDVGALNYRVYDAAPDDEKSQTRILWVTPPYADYNFTVQGDLDDEFGVGFSRNLTRAFVEMPGALAQRSFGREHMIPASSEAFAAIAVTARNLGLTR